MYLVNVKSEILHLLFTPPDGEELIRRINLETLLLAVCLLDTGDLAVERVSTLDLDILLQFVKDLTAHLGEVVCDVHVRPVYVSKFCLLPHLVCTLDSPHKLRDDGARLVCMAVPGESMCNADVIRVDDYAGLLLDRILVLCFW